MKHHGLVPERRTDRRGVTTTRWVKPAAAPAGTARSLPAVPAPREYTAADDTPRMAEMFEVLVSTRQFASSRDLALGNVHFLDAAVPDLLDRIKDVCAHDPASYIGQGSKWRHLLGSVDYEAVERRTPGATRIGVERALAAFPVAELLAPKGEAAEYMEHAYDVATVLTAESGRTQASAEVTKAMVLVAHLHGIRPNTSGERADLPGLYAAAMGDIDFIASRWAQVEPLIPGLLERGTYDRELVAAMLEGPAPAVADGLL